MSSKRVCTIHVSLFFWVVGAPLARLNPVLLLRSFGVAWRGVAYIYILYTTCLGSLFETLLRLFCFVLLAKVLGSSKATYVALRRNRMITAVRPKYVPSPSHASLAGWPVRYLPLPPCLPLPVCVSSPRPLSLYYLSTRVFDVCAFTFIYLSRSEPRTSRDAHSSRRLGCVFQFGEKPFPFLPPSPTYRGPTRHNEKFVLYARGMMVGDVIQDPFPREDIVWGT
jgi:hypothetical protein